MKNTEGNAAFNLAVAHLELVAREEQRALAFAVDAAGERALAAVDVRAQRAVDVGRQRDGCRLGAHRRALVLARADGELEGIGPRVGEIFGVGTGLGERSVVPGRRGFVAAR